MGEYLVLFGRVPGGEKFLANVHQRPLYDSMERFRTREDAAQFAHEKRESDPVVISLYDQDEHPDKGEFDLILFFKSRYLNSVSSMVFNSPKYESEQCGEKELKDLLRKIEKEEHPDQVLYGHELLEV